MFIFIYFNHYNIIEIITSAGNHIGCHSTVLIVWLVHCAWTIQLSTEKKFILDFIFVCAIMGFFRTVMAATHRFLHLEKEMPKCLLDQGSTHSQYTPHTRELLVNLFSHFIVYRDGFIADNLAKGGQLAQVNELYSGQLG